MEEQWIELKKGILEIAEDVLKNDISEGRKPWISKEVVELINERRNFKNATDQNGKQKYRRLRNEIIRKSKKDK